jgi:hypothetical protein
LAGPVARMREMREAYGVLVGKPEGKRALGRPRSRRGTLLERILDNKVRICCKLDSSASGQGQVADFLTR